jgi:hypothetical protein
LESVQRIGNIHRRDQEEILMLALQCFRELGRAGRAPDSLVASDVEIRREPHSSLLWALGTLAFTTVTFLALYIVRFSGIGIWLVKFVFLGLLGTVLFSIRDFCRSKTRGRSFLAFLLCLSVLMFFGLLTVWEGPLYGSVGGSSTPEFQVDGASGFHGIEIYGPEHSNAEWHGDDIGLIGSFDWQSPDKFPPMQLRFTYPTLPRGYSQKAPLVDATPALDPNATYTVVIRPAMSMPEYFTLHGEALTKAQNEYAAPVCWAPRSVPGRSEHICAWIVKRRRFCLCRIEARTG